MRFMVVIFVTPLIRYNRTGFVAKYLISHLNLFAVTEICVNQDRYNRL
jgi:hypothetical protein